MNEALEWLNENVIWGFPTIVVFLLTGLIFTIKLRFAQFVRLPYIFRTTLFSKDKMTAERGNLTPFQTLTAALGTTLGTGNIVAVGAAVAIGGAGAVFWMVLSAFLGMATCYAEIFLGVKYRERNADGSYFGGAFFYISAGLKSRRAAKLYALLCILASVGMGNFTQMNAMSSSVKNAFGIAPWISGAVGAIIVGVVVAGGIGKFGLLSEKLIPFLSAFYVMGCLLVIFINIDMLPACLTRIFTEAFNLRSTACGIFGSVMVRGMSWGLRRGIFSNEAGLGTSVMLHSSSSEQNPEKQGMWAMLQVFFDTVVMCTLTALALLVTGADKISTDGTETAIFAFNNVFGGFSGVFVSVSIFFFALTTVVGWSVYGGNCVVFLFGERGRRVFLIVFVISAFIGAVMKLETVWLLADFFNGVMAFPNIAALLCLSGEVGNFRCKNIE